MAKKSKEEWDSWYKMIRSISQDRTPLSENWFLKYEHMYNGYYVFDLLSQDISLGPIVQRFNNSAFVSLPKYTQYLALFSALLSHKRYRKFNFFGNTIPAKYKKDLVKDVTEFYDCGTPEAHRILDVIPKSDIKTLRSYMNGYRERRR